MKVLTGLLATALLVVLTAMYCALFVRVFQLFMEVGK